MNLQKFSNKYDAMPTGKPDRLVSVITELLQISLSEVFPHRKVMSFPNDSYETVVRASRPYKSFSDYFPVIIAF